MNIVLVKYFMLYIVPTPIGNLQDITLRALEVLKQADFVLCEDTRQTKKLLDNFGIATKTIRYHEGDKFSVGNCLNLLKGGKVCALVSDAGTPCVSDPGWQLVRRAREEGIKVCALPGPSALTCALSASGGVVDRPILYAIEIIGLVFSFCLLGFRRRKNTLWPTINLWIRVLP